MSEVTDWTRRVDQMTGASVHEQLRTVVRDAEEMLEKFTTSAYEQGGLLLDAQRELEASVERKIEQVSTEISGSLDEVRKDIASIEQTPAASIDLEPLRKDVFASIAALGEELDNEAKKIREEFAARMSQIVARISSMEESQKTLEMRVDASLRSTEERFAQIQAQLDGIAGMEDRAAERMVDLLATAFATLRSPASGPTAIAS